MGKLWERLIGCDRHEDTIRWAQSPVGRLALLGLFGLILAYIYPTVRVEDRNSWVQIFLAAALCALAGRYRAQALAITTLALLCLAPAWFPSRWLEELAQRQQIPDSGLTLLRSGMVGAVLFFSVALLAIRRQSAGRWPLLRLLAVYAGLVGLAASGWLSGMALVASYTLVWALSAYLWYLAYALRDVSRKQSSPLWFQMASFHPYFGGSWLPIGLGAANLRKLQAGNARELAICQLKGIKLLVHCLLMFWIYQRLDWVHRHFGFPPISELLREHLAGAVRYPRGVCWVSLLFSFFEALVASSYLGNLLVACARMGGYRLLQQTYKPLSALSIADYWNRISYYYKQVVVDMFFYPSFLGYFKGYPRLRQAFAIFMAACLGNLIFHFRSMLDLVAARGLGATLWGMQTYLCYCALLSAGLIASLLRSAGRTVRPGPVARAWILTKIVLFYSLLRIFDELYTLHPPGERLAFLGYLCGL